MRIYLAGGEAGSVASGHCPEQPLRLLLSYYAIQRLDLAAWLEQQGFTAKPDIFLDSGAFSAYTQRAHISLDAYCEYVYRFKHLLTVYANLDVIGDARLTLQNQRRMEQAGLFPLPVFHLNEEWNYLADYIEQYPYMALGGMAFYSGMVPHLREVHPQVIRWLVKCFKMAQGKTVFHGFACTAWDLMCMFPWYSVDSSTWLRGVKFGEISVFDQKVGKLIRMRLGDQKKCYQHAASFRSLGFDPVAFVDKSRTPKYEVVRLAVTSFQAAEQWLQRRWGKIEIPERRVA